MRPRRVEEVRIKAKQVVLRGDLSLPAGANELVVFAHGSGQARSSRRNRYVAHVLNSKGLGTLLFDLLTVEEERLDARTTELRFDIDLLAERLSGATGWLEHNRTLAHLAVGYFGASTGAAAALIAAAERPSVKAVVSRGGRPDLAAGALPYVRSPTLLIVGGADTTVLALNQDALAELRCEKELEIVPGATHYFEEPGAIGQVAELAAAWFTQHGATRAAWTHP